MLPNRRDADSHSSSPDGGAKVPYTSQDEGITANTELPWSELDLFVATELYGELSPTSPAHAGPQDLPPDFDNDEKEDAPIIILPPEYAPTSPAREAEYEDMTVESARPKSSQFSKASSFRSDPVTRHHGLPASSSTGWPGMPLGQPSRQVETRESLLESRIDSFWPLYEKNT